MLFCKCNAAKPLRIGKGPAHKVCGNTQSAALLSYFATLWLRRTGQVLAGFPAFLFRVICPNLCDFATLRKLFYIYWT